MSKHVHNPGLLGWWLVISGGLGVPQATAQEPAPVEERLEVILVELDVRVESPLGHYVAGLAADDFSLLENGRGMAIDSVEEIDLGLGTASPAGGEASAGGATEEQSRIMILLDVNNTAYRYMRLLLPQLKDVTADLFDGNTAVGLSLNAGGIDLYCGFTADRDVFLAALARAELFWQNSAYRNAFDRRFSDRYPDPVAFANHHYTAEAHTLEGFMRYLSAFDGKKNLLLVSGPWNSPNEPPWDERIASRIRLELEDVRTNIEHICFESGIRLNVMNLDRRVEESDRFDRALVLTESTGGYYQRFSTENMAAVLDQVTERFQRFYRLRYYADRRGRDYRNVRVKVRGIGRKPYYAWGYRAGDSRLEPAAVQGALTALGGNRFELRMASDWLTWSRDGRKRRTARYFLSMRVYDRDNMLRAETVLPGQLRVEKKGGAFSYPLLVQEFPLEMPVGIADPRLEMVMTDGASGKKVVLGSAIPTQALRRSRTIRAEPPGH